LVIFQSLTSATTQRSRLQVSSAAAAADFISDWFTTWRGNLYRTSRLIVRPFWCYTHWHLLQKNGAHCLATTDVRRGGGNKTWSVCEKYFLAFLLRHFSSAGWANSI